MRLARLLLKDHLGGAAPNGKTNFRGATNASTGSKSNWSSKKGNGKQGKQQKEAQTKAFEDLPLSKQLKYALRGKKQDRSAFLFKTTEPIVQGKRVAVLTHGREDSKSNCYLAAVFERMRGEKWLDERDSAVLSEQKNSITSLILAPTRTLAQEIVGNAVTLSADASMTGGIKIGTAISGTAFDAAAKKELEVANVMLRSS